MANQRLATADIVKAGELIYAAHREDLESKAFGQYAAIDVETGQIHLGEFPEVALKAAHALTPTGLFHVVRIGSSGAYRVSHLLSSHGLER